MSLAVQSVSRNWLIYGSGKRKTGLGPLTDADAAASVSPSSARLTAMRTYSSRTDLERCLCEILSIFTRNLLHCWTFQFITEWCRRPRYAERIDRPLLLRCLYIFPKYKSIPLCVSKYLIYQWSRSIESMSQNQRFYNTLMK